MLQIYNTLTRKKEVFKPLVPGKIGLYVCGVTVYDRCHLGHGRSMVCFDVMVRYLRARAYDVTFVRNITDIDDKIIDRAAQSGIAIDALTDKYIKAMHEDAKALHILEPDFEPRATAYIDSIIALIQRLIDKGFAYISESGDVCYEVRSFEGYGKLSKKDIDGLVSGARVQVVKEKRSPLDFVLWKKAKEAEPSWPSPWGAGRPGWHIECSAMAMDKLGDNFDIHGGGSDLQFPHHENEIAQSEAASGKSFANYWIHVGMLQINNEKMAKSTGNFFTIADVVKQYHPEVIRYFLISSHYRSPLNYSEENLQNAAKGLTRLYQTIKDDEQEISSDPVDAEWMAKFNEAMDDDFNTPEALSVMFQLSHEINKSKNKGLINSLKTMAAMLGILQESPASFLQAGIESEDMGEIERLIQQRLDARANKNWAQADEIRKQLQAMGIELEDSAEGTTWRKKD